MNPTRSELPHESAHGRRAEASAYSGVLGMFLGLALLKFGNPVILDWQVVAPGSFFEALIAPWPIAWGYGLAALVLCWGFRTWHWPAQVNRWWAASAFVWLGWQFVSAATTADGGLTRSVLPHFVVCVAMFALGLGTTAAVGRPSLFWLGLAGSLVVVLVVAMRQRFGGWRRRGNSSIHSRTGANCLRSFSRKFRVIASMERWCTPTRSPA